MKKYKPSTNLAKLEYLLPMNAENMRINISFRILEVSLTVLHYQKRLCNGKSNR
ncbi:MAG: hypothetical protein QM751_15700 [Paludibacteraceae bacterium]